jgi:hypothetical protein
MACGDGAGVGPGGGTPADTVRRVETALRNGAAGDYLLLLANGYVFTAHTDTGEREWGRSEDYALVTAFFARAVGYGCTMGWDGVGEPPEGVTEYTANVTMQIYVTIEGNVKYCAEGTGELTFRRDKTARTWLVAGWDDDGTGAETTLVGYDPLSWGEIKLLFEEE